jgi:hypothetical protein
VCACLVVNACGCSRTSAPQKTRPVASNAVLDAWAESLELLAKDPLYFCNNTERVKRFASALRKGQTSSSAIIAAWETKSRAGIPVLEFYYYDERASICAFRFRQADGLGPKYDYELCKDKSGARNGVTNVMLEYSASSSSSKADESSKFIPIIRSPDGLAQTWFPRASAGTFVLCLLDLEGRETQCFNFAPKECVAE